MITVPDISVLIFFFHFYSPIRIGSIPVYRHCLKPREIRRHYITHVPLPWLVCEIWEVLKEWIYNSHQPYSTPFASSDYCIWQWPCMQFVSLKVAQTQANVESYIHIYIYINIKTFIRFDTQRTRTSYKSFIAHNITLQQAIRVI